MAKVYIENISSSLYSRTLWDETGGTNYAVGDRVSLADSLFAHAGGTIDNSHNKVYICIADNNSTTHPFDDPTNWVLAGSSEEYPCYAVDGSICTNSMSNEVYLEHEASRYRGNGSNRFTWHQATAQGTEHGELIFADGEYHDDSKGFTVDRINLTAKNSGKVSITTVGHASYIFQGSNINAPETTDISTQTGIKFIVGGTKDLQHNQLALAFDSCVITDRDGSAGTYSPSSFRLGNNGNFLNLKNTLIDLPNSTISLMGYNMVLFKGQKSVWENSTIYSSAGNGNQYLPMFYGNTSNLSVKKCIFAFTTTVYSSDNWSLNFPDNSSDNLVYLYDQSAKQPAEEAGLLVQDPFFVDAANGDFRLRPSSPLIGGLQSSSKQSKLESQYPNGKWFDSHAAAGGDGSWETPYNSYADAIDSFTGDEAVVLIKEGQHSLHSGYWSSTYTGGNSAWNASHDLPKTYPNGIKFIGMGSGSIFDTSGDGISNYGAFWTNSTSNPNIRDTPFLFKDFDILMNNSAYLNRGMICARRAEYVNVNVTQAQNLGATNSQLFDYTMKSGNNDSGEYLKMSGCTVNVSLSRNSSNTAFLVGSAGGLKQYSSCTFVDLNRTTSLVPSSTPPNQFLAIGFGAYPGSYIKDCIIYTNNNTTSIFGNQSSSDALDVKNVVVYNAHISVSVSTKWSDNISITDPKFLATEPHDFDLRLRPDSSAIGGLKSEPTNVYYLQPGNPFNGDGSQKDASAMTADGDPGPFNEFNKILAAGVPYGSTVVIVNGTYSWPDNFNQRKIPANWATYTYEGYNYIAETDHGVIFDANKQQKYFGYMPFGPGDNYLDLDTTFSGIQFNNVIGSVETTSRNQIYTNSSSAGYGSCTFKSCKFLGWINTSGSASYPWTGGGRSQNGSTMHWEGCQISIAFDHNNRLLAGGDGFAADAFHGAWSWKNCTFYIASGITTFNGRNAANGTYVPISSIFGGNYDQSSRIFKNNIVYNGSGTATLGPNSANKLPTIEGNCFLGTSIETSYQPIINENQNLIDIDPLFVDASNDNFALRPLSPLIGQGK